jgi:hypothetical protein
MGPAERMNVIGNNWLTQQTSKSKRGVGFSYLPGGETGGMGAKPAWTGGAKGNFNTQAEGWGRETRTWSG